MLVLDDSTDKHPQSSGVFVGLQLLEFFQEGLLQWLLHLDFRVGREFCDVLLVRRQQHAEFGVAVLLDGLTVLREPDHLEPGLEIGLIHLSNGTR